MCTHTHTYAYMQVCSIMGRRQRAVQVHHCMMYSTERHTCIRTPTCVYMQVCSKMGRRQRTVHLRHFMMEYTVRYTLTHTHPHIYICRCVVQWDDGSGPYIYNTSVTNGLELGEMSPEHEPAGQTHTHMHVHKYSEPFRSGFQTGNRNRAHFLVCFAVFRSLRTILIETETETGLYHSHLNL